MAVIINDFEVQIEPALETAERQQPQPGASEPTPEPAAAPRPLDLDDVARRQEARRLRLWAH